MASELDELREVFNRHRSEWIAQGRAGEWAVVTEAGAHGFYPTYETAYMAASTALGDAPFLLQEVLPEDRIEHIQLLDWS